MLPEAFQIISGPCWGLCKPRYTQESCAHVVTATSETSQVSVRNTLFQRRMWHGCGEFGVCGVECLQYGNQGIARNTSRLQTFILPSIVRLHSASVHDQLSPKGRVALVKALPSLCLLTMAIRSIGNDVFRKCSRAMNENGRPYCWSRERFPCWECTAAAGDASDRCRDPVATSSSPLEHI